MNETSTVSLEMVPSMARNIHLGDSVVMSDNMEATIPPMLDERLKAGLPTRTLKPKDMTFPYRLAFNVILFVDSGQIDVKINMKHYRLGNNSIFLTSSGVFLDMITYQAGTRFMIIGYSDTSHYAAMQGRSARIIKAATYTPLLLQITKDRMDRYRQVLMVLLHVADGGPDYSFKEDIVNGFADIISGGIARIILERDKSKTRPGRTVQIMREFISLIQANCMTERELDFYADKLCISSKYLSRVVKSVSGKNAGDIISDNAIPLAERLLVDGRYNVQQVSNMMRFSSPSYFGRYFSKATGMSPRRYQVKFGD